MLFRSHRIAIDTLQLIKKKTGKNFVVADLLGKRWMCNHQLPPGAVDFTEFCKTLVERGECEFYNRVFQKKATTIEAKRLVSSLQQEGPLSADELMARAQEEKLCSYEIALLLSKKAQVIIADYNYLFNPHIREAILGKLDKKLQDITVIVDEGHNLPGRVTEMLSSSLTTITLHNALLEARKFKYLGVIDWLQQLNSILTKFNMLYDVPERLIEKEDLVQHINSFVPYEMFIKELEAAAEEIRQKQRKSYLGGISSFLQQWQGPEEGYARILSEQQGKLGPVISLSYHCLDPSLVTKEIFSAVKCGVIMSGTLQPTSLFRDLLGIERPLEKSYPSPFPPENKITLIVPETSTKYSLRQPEMYRTIGRICSELAVLIPGNIAFFFPSYQLRDSIADYFSTDKKRFWEKQSMSSEDKEMFLQEFAAARRQGGVLLGVAGANFAEGVDFPGDLLQGVVIVGLPLSKPNLKIQQTIRYYDQKFNKGWDYAYIIPAMTKCIQSAGRCIRSETDRGVVVFLDERFAWQQYYACFPEKVGLRVTTKYQNLIREFFTNKDRITI